ncbi:MAG: O-antigen ligase family protein [Bacteroidales bacterium]|nr:O-antigen ligase family protein [Bacteroidales bacterium]
MKITLFFIVCLIVFIRPLWGIPILIIVTSTLFHLSHYMIFPLSVGAIESAEAIIIIICVRLLLDKVLKNRWKYSRAVDSIETEDDVFVKSVLLSAIIPYILWQTFTVFYGAVSSIGTEHFRFGIRFFLNGVVPWLIIWILWQQRNYKDKILYSVALITIITAVVHIVIQLTDYRAIMPMAYWGNPSEEYMFVYESRMLRLGYEAFIRALPQGVMLILFLSVYYFSKYINETLNRKTAASLSIICSVAIIITITRSLLFALLCGFLIALFLASYYHIINFTGKFRVMTLFAILVIVASVYSAVNPTFLNTWQERLYALQTGFDAKIFSEDNPARGLDNVASLEAIKDSPFLGYGSPRYHHKYSYRLVPPTDIHPLLQIGLVGGIPAILLFIRLLYLIIWRIGLPSASNYKHIVRILPFTTILIMTAVVVNTIGAGGTINGNGLIAMTIIIGLLAIYYPVEVPENR